MPLSILRRAKRRRTAREESDSPSVEAMTVDDEVASFTGSMASPTALHASLPSSLTRAADRSFSQPTPSARPFANVHYGGSATSRRFSTAPLDLDVIEELATDGPDAVARLVDISREHARLEVYYGEMHRRYAAAKEEITFLRAQVDALQEQVGQKEKRIKSLKNALRWKR